MKRLALLLAAAALTTAAGCDNGGSPPPSPSAAPTVAEDGADLPVPADYAQESERTITPANYKSELDALEKEIHAE